MSRRRRRRGEEETRRGEEEQATNIKSNNPHLAGGEKDNRHCSLPFFFEHVFVLLVVDVDVFLPPHLDVFGRVGEKNL